MVPIGKSKPASTLGSRGGSSVATNASGGGGAVGGGSSTAATSGTSTTPAMNVQTEHKDDQNNNNTTTTPQRSVTAVPSTPMLECDYDRNPTVLYQAIEARQWAYALTLFDRDEQDYEDDDDDELERYASSTWVVRKETNGKLRWRQLPLHAAVVFGAPLKLIEVLLADYPEAVQCKDDQGMTPLHVAFRYQASWDVIDELLTSFPMAVFVTDRKGRTPLQCGASAAAASSSTASISSSTATAITNIGGGGGFGTGKVSSSVASCTDNTAMSSIGGFGMISGRQGGRGGNSTTTSSLTAGGGLINSSSRPGDHGSTYSMGVDYKSQFRSILSVLELYAQIAVSGEKKRAEAEARSLANASITQLQESHVRTLTTLKHEWERQQKETERQMERTENEKQALQRRVRELENQIEKQKQSQSTSSTLSREGTDKVKELIDRYSNLVEERDQIRSILDRRLIRGRNGKQLGDTTDNSTEDDDNDHNDQDEEIMALQSFRTWFSQEYQIPAAHSSTESSSFSLQNEADKETPDRAFKEEKKTEK